MMSHQDAGSEDPATGITADVERMLGSTIVWLGIKDDPGKNGERGYIERNAIALLSNYQKEPLDPASPNWLGRSCNRLLLRESQL